MAKKRNRTAKFTKVECMECHEMFYTNVLAQHIKRTHCLSEYIKKYGEFRKNKLNKNKPAKRKVNRVICKICQKKFTTVGLSGHLSDTHNMTTEGYIEKYGEFRPKFLDYNKRAKENGVVCLVCNKEFGSERLLTYHIKKEHHITKQQYVIDYVYKGNIPKCKCGCGEKVKTLNQPPYNNDFIAGHNSIGENNPRFNVRVKAETKIKMKNRAISRMGISDKKNTIPENKIKELLVNLNKEFIQQYPTDYGVVDFYIVDDNMLVEVDGEYWHPMKKEHLNFQLISGAISDKNKSNLHKLYRVRENDIDKITTLNDIKKFNKHPDLSILNRQIIMEKEYFKHYIEKNGKDKLEKYISLLLKFVRVFQPEFPYPKQTDDVSIIIDKIKKYDLTNIIKDNVFRNNCSLIGVGYLKAHHKSYWNSNYKDKKTPVEAWLDDDIMRKIIKYRIGINDSNEIFDFSLHQLIMGLSAARYTISFFKPMLAAAIYLHILGSNATPTVIDPCSGFGGRLLGFKSIYPNGKYIGIEPNKEAYNELVELSKNFNNIELHNCKMEDYTGPKDCDLTFTSIPYFNLEEYSGNSYYSSFSEWENTFIKSLQTFQNKEICMSKDIADKLNFKYKYKISNNTSHFDKKNKVKYEVITDM